MPIPNASQVQVIDSAVSHRELPLVIGSGKARAILWPETGARYRTMHILDLVANDRTVDLRHDVDCAWYVSKGVGCIRNNDDGTVLQLVEGAMLHIDAGDGYRIESSSPDGITVIGGPVPADNLLYASAKQEAV